MPVFGIGLPKTCSTSLDAALRILGYASCHYNTQVVYQVWHGNYKLPGKYNAFVHCADYFYPQFDHRYPGSKFILTVRDMDKWLSSCKRWFSLPKIARKVRDEHDVSHRYLVHLFGSCIFEPDRFRYAYELHLRNVKEYFKDKDNLLITDLSVDGWSKLCLFLDKPVPEAPFPRLKVTSEVKREHSVSR